MNGKRSLQLRVTKPGFMRGIDALARSAEPVPHLPSIEKWRQGDRSTPYDANRDASRQELRSMVCGQCHVTYHCGPKTTLFFPWANGLKVERMEATYDAIKFPDGHRFYEFQRKAQWRVDCINAENAMGFHAPQEAARVLGEAIDFSRQGQLALRDIRDKQAK